MCVYVSIGKKGIHVTYEKLLEKPEEKKTEQNFRKLNLEPRACEHI